MSFDKRYERINRPPLETPGLLSGNYWAELRIFLAVAKCKSFNRAAEMLHITQPTVSRSVQHLEDILGYKLVERSKTGISLTEGGGSLAHALLEVDEAIFAKVDELKNYTKEPSGMVRITSTEGLCAVYIISNLKAFTAKYPKVRLHLKNPVNIMGYRENQADIVLSYAAEAAEGLTSRPSGYLHLIPVASRSYIEKFGMPSQANLSEHRFIDAGYYMSENETWRPWRSVVARGNMDYVCDNTINHARMLRSGLGIGLTGSHLLADPELVPVDLDVHIRLPLFLNVSSERLMAKPVRVTFDWLSGIFDEKYPWFARELNTGNLPSDALNAVFTQYFDPPEIGQLPVPP